MSAELAAVGASSIAGIGNIISQNSANDANQQMAREQMSFQERMSNTAYQRATADMKAAGINPMLAYMKGGASSPSGASSTFQSGRAGDAISGGVSTALEATRLKKDVERVDTQNDLEKKRMDIEKADRVDRSVKTMAERDLIDAQRALVDAQKIQTQANTIATTNSGLKTKLEAEDLQNKMPYSKDKAEMDRRMIPIQTMFDTINKGLSTVGTAKDLVTGPNYKVKVDPPVNNDHKRDRQKLDNMYKNHKKGK